MDHNTSCMRISVIIPTVNEAANVPVLIRHLRRHGASAVEEILVIDGGSTDDTLQQAREAGARVYTAAKGRAVQMNLGAAHASGDILYFVHADTLPPASFTSDIQQAVQEGYDMGCFRSRFDSDKLLLKINGYCSRFKGLMCRGGDQTLFVRRQLFDALQGYDPYYVVMEEYDFIRRAWEKGAKFTIMAREAQVSARKYDNNSYLRVNMANFVVFNMFKMGYAPSRLRSVYRRLIDYSV